MNSQTRTAIAYAENALSFLFLDNGVKDHIKGVYLFGSAVRGELTKGSDIDLFIDCPLEQEKLIKGISKAAVSRFYASKDFEKWRMFKFDYPLSVQAGDLAAWDLRKSIIAEGILIYSTSIPAIKKGNNDLGKRITIFTVVLPKRKKDYIKFIRAIAGRNEKGYKDSGLLGEIKGERLGTNVFIVPTKSLYKVKALMDKFKVWYEMREVQMVS